SPGTWSPSSPACTSSPRCCRTRSAARGTATRWTGTASTACWISAASASRTTCSSPRAGTRSSPPTCPSWADERLARLTTAAVRRILVGGMDAEDRLRLDYDRTTDLVQSLLDTRFKLLALVPTIAGTAVGLVGTPRPAVELLGIGVLGLVATVGILLYELRNSEILEAMLEHAKILERVLGFGTGPPVPGPRGL